MGTSGYRVLIVDDEEMVRNLVVSVLSKRGHICETASNGLEGLDKMEKNNFDAVITDMEMPKIDGIGLTTALLREYPDLPIMVMTGFTKEYCIGSAIAVGARDFIKKPFSIANLMLSFNTMMRDQEVRSRIEARRDGRSIDLERGPHEKIEHLRNQVQNLRDKLSYVYDVPKNDFPVSESAVSAEYTW